MNTADKRKTAFWSAALGGLAIAAFLSYSYLSLAVPGLDNSPDENSNRFFSALYAHSGRLWQVEIFDNIYPGIVHPRSVIVKDGFLLPGGFLGLPVIYGGLAKAFGAVTMPFLTAFFSLLGALGLGLALRRSFGTEMAVLAGILLAFQPNWWYQSGRPFMPNILFVSLLLLSAGFLFGRPIGERGGRLAEWIDPVTAGIFLGLALAVRPTEAYWLAIAAAVLLAVFGFRKIWRPALALGISAAAVLVPFLALNRTVYGSLLASGYGASPADVMTASLPAGFGARLIGPLQPYLFPMGFAPRSALSNFWDFGLGIFSWWWLAAAAAAVVLSFIVWQGRRRPEISGSRRSLHGRAWAISALAISAWLIIFYGSWTIRDNPDPNAISVGSSYLRYWLPISVFSVLPVAWGLSRLWRRFRSGQALAVLAVSAIVALSGPSVFLAPHEGFLAMERSLIRSNRQAERVLSLTDERQLIVTDRADKFLWPARPVIQPLRSEATWEALAFFGPRLGRIGYFGITLPESDIEWLNTVKLPPLGLRISLVEEMSPESLYVFERLEE